MKKILIWMLALSMLLLCGCGATAQEVQVPQKQYTATFLTLFDTVTSIVGKAESEEAFYEKV